MASPRRMHARPVCGLCRRPVDEFTEEDGTGTLAVRVIFVARCHGAVERQTAPRHLTRGMNFGVAFQQRPALPAGGQS